MVPASPSRQGRDDTGARSLGCFNQSFGNKLRQGCSTKHLVRKPIEGTVKINVDASFCEETLSGLSGAVGRDHKGNFISATTWVLPHVRSAESAELSAIRNDLYLAGRIE